MRRRSLAVLFLAWSSLSLWAQAQPSTPPKLVLAIVVDQCRYDYMTRFRADFTGGLKRLLDQGAVFTNANYQASPTVTAVGHSTFLTGAMPAKSGIIGNQWWDRTEGKAVTSVSDDKTRLLGGRDSSGSSPERLLVSTVGDELKTSGKGGKVMHLPQGSQRDSSGRPQSQRGLLVRWPHRQHGLEYVLLPRAAGLGA